ncbi:MAG: sigma-70 family RNA polymerase sigma factor [Roseinatronobacter sp.]|nr:sigma-70 family RNA polymerase sigma factor [Roseinatronobacter sp.]
MLKPTEAEIAAELQLSPDELARWRGEIDSGSVASIDDIYTDHSIMFRDQSPDIEDKLTLSARKVMLKDAIAALPEREALVLQLYYVEELNVYEVAAVLGVTTGRVSQIKKAAMERLRKLMDVAENTRR